MMFIITHFRIYNINACFEKPGYFLYKAKKGWMKLDKDIMCNERHQLKWERYKLALKNKTVLTNIDIQYYEQ